MASGNNVQIIIQAVDSASNVLKAIGSSSEGMGQSVEKAMATAARDAQKAQAALIGLGSSVTDTIGSFKSFAANAGMIGIGATVVNAAKNWALSVYDLRRSIGSTAEDASKLLAIGKYAGIGTDEAAGYFAKFGKAVSKAKDEMMEAEAKGKASNDIFSRLGFTLSDLQGKNSAEIFAKIAEKMRNMADGADKDRIAMELFGKSGFQVTEMMNLSQEQMDAVIKKAQDMGMILDDQTTEAWKNLDRQMNAVIGTGQKMAIQIGNDMLPVLQEKVTALKDMTDAYGKLSPEMRQTIGLTIEATGEFAALRLGAQGLGALMPWFSSALCSPWTAAVIAIGLTIEKFCEFANLVGMNNAKQIAQGDYSSLDDMTREAMKSQLEGSDESDDNKRRRLSKAYNESEGWAKLYSPSKPDVPKTTVLNPPVIGGGGGGGGGGRHGADKFENQAMKAENLLAELNQKITEQSGSTYEISTAKLNTEVTKWKNEMTKMQEAGVDTSALSAKIDEYQTVFKEKIVEKWKEAWTAVKNNTKLIGAQIIGDKSEEEEAEYQVALQRIEKERKDREKEIRQSKDDAEAIAAAQAEADAKIAKAAQIRDEKIRSSHMEKYQQELDYATLTQNLEGKTNEQIDKMRQDTLINYNAYLRKELENKKLTDQERLELEKKLNENIKQQQEIAGRNMQTAAAEAMRRIKAQTTDYADAMVSAYNSMYSEVEGHLNNMLSGAESFSSGFKGIISDMVTEVQKMLVKMFMDQYVKAPMQSFMSSVLGRLGASAGTTSKVSSKVSSSLYAGASSGLSLGFFSGTPGNSYSFNSSLLPGRATGGLADGWTVVGENGPELANFTNPTRIYSNRDSQNLLSGGSSSPQIVMHIHTQDAASFRQSKGQILAQYSAAMRAAGRNT